MSEQKIQPGDSAEITRRYLDSILIEQKLIGSVTADPYTDFFGYRTMPYMLSAYSYLPPFKEGREDAALEYARVFKEAGLVYWCGMMSDEQYERIVSTGVRTVRIVKPFADHEKIISQLRTAERCGALAVGMDIDHIFGNDGNYDNVLGEEMGPQTADDLKAYIGSTDLPFIVKGVLSADDARMSLACGAKGIVVSHHHGRIPFSVPPMMVLPEIRKALGNADMKIFTDCSIASGADVYKVLALGCDGAGLGRSALWPLMNGDMDTLRSFLGTMRNELKMIMAFTGCSDVSEITSDRLWKDGKKISDAG